MTETAIKCNDMWVKYIYILAILSLTNCTGSKSSNAVENISNENIQATKQTKIEDEINEIESMQSRNPIVKIYTICHGACGGQPTEYLDFLLFSNGKVEYDSYDESENEISSKKVKTLETDEIENFQKIIEKIFSSKIKTKYKADYTEDVFTKTEITIWSKEKKKTIKILEGDVLIHSNRTDKLPQNLINLIKEVERINDTRIID
jgi:hypothetical protein